ncbi:MAG: NrdH-redoxin [Gammaproteobacteria bacterium]|nr:MAG: NrdH-redoxin [Gammaproteobacteria bacterium]
MKKLIVLVVLFLIYQKWGLIDHYLNPPPDYSIEHDGKLILYATDWCGYCKKTRKLLKTNNIPYFEYDIEKSKKGREQFDSLGGRGVPLILIRGNVIKGYDPALTLELAK